MGEIILATVLMELGEAVIQELQRHLGGLLALKEMLVELLTIDDIDGAGLVGADGNGSGIAIETVGIAAHKVARLFQRLAPLHHAPLPVLHAVLPQELQIKSLLVGVELLILLVCHVALLCDLKIYIRLGCKVYMIITQ